MSIIGKFLKIAGKDPNGNAKGVAVTENGEVKVQQTGSNVSPFYIDASSSTQVNAGSNEIITITPTSGYVGYLEQIYLNVDKVGSSGTGSHGFEVFIGDSPLFILLEISNDETSRLTYRGNSLTSGNLNRPSSIEVAQLNLKGLPFSADKPLSINYRNNSDANNQTGSRFIRLYGFEEAII